MGSYHIWTMGCQMNVADSQALAQGLEALGHRPALALESADFIVINTCVVRQGAEDKALAKVASLRPLKQRGHSPVIALAGCLVDSQTSGLRRRFPHIDLFLKPGEARELLDLAREAGPREQASEPPREMADRPPSPTAFVPIITGCDNLCTYCIVPYRRGRERSRPLEEIACQVRSLTQRGAREVTLVGQNVDAYGHDLPGRPRPRPDLSGQDLADLLSELNSIPGLARLRFLTSHPRDMTDKLIGAVAALDKVCPHLCLPVQAGDDAILQAMGRGYTVEEYRNLAYRIRQAIPGVALSTDVIVGFPGEAEAQFQRTYDLLAELRFDTVHVAAYSPRPGTAAARTLPDDVPPEVKRERLHRVEALQESISAEINAAYVGKTVEVLVEGEKKGQWWGRTRTDKLTFFPGPFRPGDLVEVKVERAGAWSLQGVAT